MMTTPKQYLVSLSTSLVAVSLLFAPHTAQASRDDGIQLRVSNGKQARECNFPGVVLLGNCTGTLVHPKVVVYAAHCGKRQSVTLTHSSGAGKRLGVAKCNTNPRYGSASQEHLDWAYCVLKKEAKDWPIIPVAAGCEMDLLAKSGGEVVQCGFGRSNDGGPSFGRKRYAASKITGVTKGEITVGDAGGVVACPGDSGGPLLARLKDGSWRTIGITSTYNGRCGSGGMNTYANIARALAWIEKDSGIDITPCFNSKQEWEPGPGCGGFFAGDMDSASGTWANACKGTELSGLSTTCGSQGPDKEAPKVSIKISKGKDLVEPAKISIEATAKDNVKVTNVELFMNDKSQGKLEKSPYSWTIKDLDAGEYEFKAIAMDGADNKGESDEVALEVKEEEESNSSEPDEDDDDETKKKKKKKKKKKSDDDDENVDDDSDDDDDDADDDTDDDADEKTKKKKKKSDANGDDDKRRGKRGCSVDAETNDTGATLLALCGLFLLGRKRRR